MAEPGYKRKGFKLYSTARWQKLRKQQLEGCPLCVFCANLNKATPATVADHIEPHHGDEDKFWNGELQSLCADCHNSLKRFIETCGYDRTIGRDGYPVSPMHPFNRASLPFKAGWAKREGFSSDAKVLGFKRKR